MQQQWNEGQLGSLDTDAEAAAPARPATPDNGAAPAVQADVAAGSLWSRIGRRLRHHPLDVVLLIALGLLGAVGLLGTRLAPYDPVAVYVGPGLAAPSPAHLFGTDELGRDVFSRVLAGTPYSLASAGIILGSALLISILCGTIAGYFGGLVDVVIMRITDMFLAFPSLILALAITAALGPGLTNALLAIALVWWPWYARLIRGQVLAIKRREYVEAARAVGMSSRRIMFRHILPNYLTPLAVQVSLDVGAALVTTASLGFLGLGAQPPTPEWGTMIGAGRQYFLSAWWDSAFPGLAIFMVVLLFTIVSERLPSYLS